MTVASFAQWSFLGGEWATYSQGRSDLPTYRQAMTVCLNHVILEEGAATRRSGTECLGPTYLRTAAKFLGFESSAATPFLLEFTNNALRMWYGSGPVCTNDRNVITASSSSGGVLTLTGTGHTSWAVGDQIVLYMPTTLTAANIAVVLGRQLQVTAINTGGSNDILTVKDDMGNALPSNITSGGLNGATMIRLLRITTTIPTASLTAIRLVQLQSQGVILWGGAPQTLTITTDVGTGTDADAVFSYAAATFTDGPYNTFSLNASGQPDTATVSGYNGSITVTPAYVTPVSGDVGRHIRLFSEPPAWASGTTYGYGALVKYNGAYWQSTQASNTGNYPGTPTLSGGVQQNFWAAVLNVQQWVWGKITAAGGGTWTVTLTDASGTGGASGTIPSANGTTITQYCLGTYQSGSYPTCGTSHEGRLWLSGAAANRIDGSMSNSFFQFSPTDQYGNVNDNNAVSGTLNLKTLCTFYWMVPITEGILCGTNGGEVLISATTAAEPITPATFQAKRVTTYKAAFVDPLTLGISTVFVQKYQRRVLEYVETFNFTGAGFAARHLNEHAKHLSAAGVKELAYQEEKSPIVWALMNDGSLAGCTYRRVSKFVTDPPTVEAWHRHTISDVNTINSMAVIAGTNGWAIADQSDYLYLNTCDLNGQYWVELMRPLFEEA